MDSLFRNKYKIGSARYHGYDYCSPGKYFITICTKNKIPYFGKFGKSVETPNLGVSTDTGIIFNKFLRKKIINILPFKY
ncbi:MAG TPA: hypothetical protein DDW27_22110 [Bacteroidales bacterium]|nr:hypothetical protein [Bacteroidales bacterium]